MVYVDRHVTPKKACKNELEKRASNIFFIKMEYVLANLEGSNFKISLPVGPNHGGASLDTTILK